ncbi:MAG: threonylcarbamoyl-AMP synthase [Clostridia bacterium]|nr:threonylcarbamoyl-AMP synthase [Clostridia bacterium]
MILSRNEIDDEKLKAMSEKIRNGNIVVFPTETVYGIGTNGLNEESIKKLYEVKQREFNKPISLLVSDVNMIKELTKDITEIEYKLIDAFCPGPFTIILKKKDIVPNILTANGATVGIRMPENEIARKLVKYSGVPVAAPSANISGKPSGIEIEDIVKDFEGKVEYFIDGGKSKLGIGSTIVRVIDGMPKILRQGSITKEQIEKVVGFTLIM